MTPRTEVIEARTGLQEVMSALGFWSDNGQQEVTDYLPVADMAHIARLDFAKRFGRDKLRHPGNG